MALWRTEIIFYLNQVYLIDIWIMMSYYATSSEWFWNILQSDSASLWIIWNHSESSLFTLFSIIWNDFSKSFWIVVNYESLWIILIHLESVWIIAWGLDELRGLLCSSLKIILRNFISQQEVFLFLKEHQQASASIKRTQFFLPPPRLVSPNWS